MDDVNIPLSAPINAFGKSVTALTLRPMTGKDLRMCGFPFQQLDDGVRIDAAAVSNHISALGGIPLSSVDQLSAPDWQRCMRALNGFLAEPATPAADTTESSS